MKYNDKKNPYSYRGFGYDTQTNILVEFLKSRVLGMNVVNFFIELVEIEKLQFLKMILSTSLD